MIGDPKQLPATVFSNKAQKKFYDRSLFLRFQLNGFPVHMLDTQYRMHPDISKFVSKNFYDSKLHNSDNILQLIGDPPFYKIPGFAPVTFFDIEVLNINDLIFREWKISQG